MSRALAASFAASLAPEVTCYPDGFYVHWRSLKQWLCGIGFERPASYLNGCLSDQRVASLQHEANSDLYDVACAPLLAEFYGVAPGIVDWGDFLHIVRTVRADATPPSAASGNAAAATATPEESGAGTIVTIAAAGSGCSDSSRPGLELVEQQDALVPLESVDVEVDDAPASLVALTREEVSGMDRPTLENAALVSSRQAVVFFEEVCAAREACPGFVQEEK